MNNNNIPLEYAQMVCNSNQQFPGFNKSGKYHLIAFFDSDQKELKTQLESIKGTSFGIAIYFASANPFKKPLQTYICLTEDKHTLVIRLVNGKISDELKSSLSSHALYGKLSMQEKSWLDENVNKDINYIDLSSSNKLTKTSKNNWELIEELNDVVVFSDSIILPNPRSMISKDLTYLDVISLGYESYIYYKAGITFQVKEVKKEESNSNNKQKQKRNNPYYYSSS